MKKANKIIRRRTAPMIAGIVFSSLLLTEADLLIVDILGGVYFPEEKAIVAGTSSLFLGMLCLVIWTVVKFNKQDYKFASQVAREYLQNIMTDNPEMKKFERVLSNPQAVQSIATMISNSLDKSEQDRILSFATKMQEVISQTVEQDKKAVVIKRAHEGIIKIIQKHAVNHPEFIQELSAAVAYADKTYFMPIQQRIRE